MSDFVTKCCATGTYFLEEINNPEGILVTRIIVIIVALFVVGFYCYIKKKK